MVLAVAESGIIHRPTFQVLSPKLALIYTGGPSTQGEVWENLTIDRVITYGTRVSFLVVLEMRSSYIINY